MNDTQSSQQTIVIKVGGSFFNSLQSASEARKLDSKAQHPLLATIAKLQAKKINVVLVHGGGEQVQSRLKALNMQSVRKNGLRVTPDSHMPIVTGVLAGELNKQLVTQCCVNNINAVGISLADGDLAECKPHPADIGAVGEPQAKDPKLLYALTSLNIVPIVASVGKDKLGRLYNINADHAAICIAKLLNTKLYFFADVPGVLNDKKQLITHLDAHTCMQLINDKIITDGMIVKVKAAQHAANEIKQSVIIASWDNAQALLLDNQISGTEVLPDGCND